MRFAVFVSDSDSYPRRPEDWKELGEAAPVEAFSHALPGLAAFPDDLLFDMRCAAPYKWIRLSPITGGVASA